MKHSAIFIPKARPDLVLVFGIVVVCPSFVWLWAVEQLPPASTELQFTPSNSGISPNTAQQQQPPIRLLRGRSDPIVAHHQTYSVAHYSGLIMG